MVGLEPTTDTAYKAAALTAELHPEIDCTLPGRAEVRWTVPPGQEDAAEALAQALRREIGMVPIPPPDDWPE